MSGVQPRRDQQLARRAWAIVDGCPDGARGELRSRVVGLGSMLRGAGLAATLAFLQAKADPAGESARGAADQHLYTQLVAYLAGVLRLSDDQADPARFVVEVVADLDADRYALAGRQTRVLADWLRRAAEATP